MTTAVAAARASAALLLTHWWSRPTEEELDGWSLLWRSASETTAALPLRTDHLEALREALELSPPESLLDEYERLLVGPGRPPCAPYESLWRTDLPPTEQGLLMGSAADAVAAVYRELGLAVRTTESHELPDHLLLEWEALAYAIEQGESDAADQLLRGHLARWIGPFCDAVAAQAQAPFYAALAQLTAAWTSALAA